MKLSESYNITLFVILSSKYTYLDHQIIIFRSISSSYTYSVKKSCMGNKCCEISWPWHTFREFIPNWTTCFVCEEYINLSERLAEKILDIYVTQFFKEYQATTWKVKRNHFPCEKYSSIPFRVELFSRTV